MAYRQNSTAIGAYRTTEGNIGDLRTDAEPPAGWAAYDKEGRAWRITEAEAVQITRRAA